MLIVATAPARPGSRVREAAIFTAVPEFRSFRCGRTAALLLATALLLGCTTPPAVPTTATGLTTQRAAGSLLVVLPSRALVERQVLGATTDHRQASMIADIARSDAETVQLGERARAARLFDQITVIRADQPQDADGAGHDYRLWAQQGSDSLLWYLAGPAGTIVPVGFAGPDGFATGVLAAAHRLGDTIQDGVGAPLVRVGNNRVFQTPVTADQEDLVIEIHDPLPAAQRRIILRHVMASKVFRKYQPIIDARAKLYCPDGYSLGYNFIGRRLLYPAIGASVYCE